LLLILSCQDVPQKYKTPEGRSLLQKYKKQFVEGVVILSEDIPPDALKDKRYLIVWVRKPQSQRPVAVLRIENPRLPYRFKITGRDKLRRDELIEGELIVGARLSSDKSAGFKDGDIYGFTNAKAGQRDVKLILNHVYREEKK
ncbi:MAG: hypothetical protein GXO04_02505, partial [Aquificae bacterium]|nr:hypothetical protein [Aquificota bacterium]